MCGCEELRMELWFRRKPSFNPLTACQTVGMGRACADHPPLTQFSTRPPPSKSHLACHLSPRPPKKKKKKSPHDQFKAPARTMSSFCIYCSAEERALTAGSYLREWKVGGVKGVNATQREVRKGKLAIHEALGRGGFFGGGGGFRWPREKNPLPTQHRARRVFTGPNTPGAGKHHPNKEKHVNQEGYFKMYSITVTNYLLQKCVICNVIHLSQNWLWVWCFLWEYTLVVICYRRARLFLKL